MANLIPTTDLVVAAWLRSIPGLVNVGPELPSNQSSWVDAGFVQAFTVGGTPNPDIPQAEAAVEVNCWATNSNSSKSPWGKANQLAEIVRTAQYDFDKGFYVETPGQYRNARILSIWMLSEPRRVNNDPNSFARYTFDIEVVWVVQD